MHGWRTVVTALAVGLAACGGGDTEHAELGAQVVAAVCARHERCGQYASAQACEQDLRRWGWDTWMGLGTRYDEALDDGRLRFDSDAARQCLDRIRDGDCRLPVLPQSAFTQGIEYASGCQVIRDAESGGECESHFECGDGAYCEYSSANDCEGVCQLRRQAGATATRLEQCELGLVLFGGRCVRPVGEGGNCYASGPSGALPCGPGLWCDDESRTCRRTGARGDACVSGTDAPCGASFVCKDGFCSQRSQPGAPCRTFEANSRVSVRECQDELFCDADALTTGNCQRRRDEGSACRDSLECAEGLDCVGEAQASGVHGTCMRKPVAGEACNADTRLCEGGLVCSGVCVQRARKGERCESVNSCDTGSVCWEGRCIPGDAFACQ